MSKTGHWITLLCLTLLFAVSGSFLLFCGALAVAYPLVSFVLITAGIIGWIGAVCSMQLMESYV